MITALDATLLNLTGGVRLKQRVQHPSVIERKDRGQHYWFFRYREDELLPSGSYLSETLGSTRMARRVGG